MKYMAAVMYFLLFLRRNYQLIEFVWFYMFVATLDKPLRTQSDQYVVSKPLEQITMWRSDIP
jgi:hypothetical protein